MRHAQTLTLLFIFGCTPDKIGDQPATDTDTVVEADTDTDTDADADTDTDTDTDADVDAVAPVAIDDAVAGMEGEERSIDVVTNDTDADGDLDVATVSIIDSPGNGTATVNVDGTVDYSHDGTETTSDVFTYTVGDSEGNTSNIATVLLEIMPVNDPPEAVDDDFNVDEDEVAVVDLAANDSDPDDGLDLASISLVDAPSFGSVSVNNDGTVAYNHDGTENFSDDFTYVISDLAGASSNLATVTVTIAAVNDPPDARFDFVALDEGALGIFDLAANDADADGVLDLGSIVVTVPPTFGTLVLNGDGTVDYQHDDSDTTSDAFFYTIDDDLGDTSNAAMVDITVNPIADGGNIAPTANDDAGQVDKGEVVVLDLIANDFDPDDGIDPSSLIIIDAPIEGTLVDNGDGTVDYQHDNGVGTSDSFTYQVTDFAGASSNTAMASLRIHDPGLPGGFDPGDYDIVITHEHEGLMPENDISGYIGNGLGILYIGQDHAAIPPAVLQDPNTRVWLMWDYEVGLGLPFDIAFEWAYMTLNADATYPAFGGDRCALDLVEAYQDGIYETSTALDISDPNDVFELPAAPLDGYGNSPFSFINEGVNLFDVTDIPIQLTSPWCMATMKDELQRATWHGGDITYLHGGLATVVRNVRIVVGYRNP